MHKFICQNSLVVALALCHSLQASEETIGPKGINSIATGLNGFNVAIGQVEGNRPGKHGFDTDANCCNDKVVPHEVFARNNFAGENQAIGEHALWVASVMISKQDTIGGPGGISKPLGVAPEAILLSSAYIFEPVIDLQQDAALAAQALAPYVWAINMSFGVP